ncbi:hypothetical protein O7635_23440 [Asanoa sp. WMMD1127]|uniref:hypothetical protein n=1 Tax=Asanoa sp. WMMD1127 TaxID=3016107 RepID=UPI002417C5A9|nr:hypothetical protein [Asanoa sp. WMMD1127]MDG4824814.1 hypothetical protein [Asanoa sp. WMMD1127]
MRMQANGAASDLRWVYRPPRGRRSPESTLAGAPVFGVSAADAAGLVDVILADGTRLTAPAADVVAEPI